MKAAIICTVCKLNPTVRLLFLTVIAAAVTVILVKVCSKPKNRQKYTYVSPEVGASVNITLDSNDPVTLIKSADNELSTLVSWDGTFIKPVGRSYNGYDWEAYSIQDTPALTFTCTTDSCTVTLPALVNATYQLTTFTHSLPAIDVAARFLEQATFGPTNASLSSFVGEAAWIKDQIYSVPLSSHRQFFREHANYRFEVPSRMGIVTQPCDANTHYRKCAFTAKDMGRLLEIQQAPSGKYYLMIDGEARTVVGDVKYYDTNNTIVPFLGNGSYVICLSLDRLGRPFAVKYPGVGCVSMVFDNVFGNPVVYFDEIHPPSHEIVALPTTEVQPVNQALYGGAVEELFVSKDLSDETCKSIPSWQENRNGTTARTGRYVAGVYNGEYFLHDSRFVLNDNTLENPIPDGGGSLIELTTFDDPAYERGSNEVFITTCANVPRTFLNEANCVLSYESSFCSSAAALNMIFNVEYETMGLVFKATGGSRNAKIADGPGTRYVYAITGLRNDKDYVDAPCTPGARSRWLNVNIEYCNNNSLFDYPPDVVSDTTKIIFEDLIRESVDPNQYLQDVTLPTTGVTGCSPNTYNFTVLVDDTCWKNVDPDLLTVYDFTNWVAMHPGGRAAIQRFAQFGNNFQLKFPESHPLDRWYDNGLPNLIKIGRLGDQIPWSDLPVEIAGNSYIASSFGAQTNTSTGGGGMVCGSPYEVANNPLNYGASHGSGFDLATYWNSTTGSEYLEAQRVETWIQLALHAPDQLRQRVAWALSQLFVISPASIGSNAQSEHYLTYYDIFIRNAFGNFRNILKEVAYSPMMAEMLTYLRSQSTAYIWASQYNLEYADENFAREVMQLFTIGLYELNNDGTQKLNNGVPLQTYTNFDITEYARVWTGFDQQSRRGNVEEPSVIGNRIDPMQIRLEWRDYLPKMGLNGRYIGDGWPLCSDLPHQHFLKAGATFRLLGTRSDPELQKDPPTWDESVRPSLDSESLLYKKLCNKVSDLCSYQAKVVLDEDLGLCTGFECNIDTLRVFRVEDVFYEYVRLPCVHQAFYNNAKLVKTVSDNSDFLCADPRTEVASTACCLVNSNDATVSESFPGERVTFDTATSRCDLCDQPEIKTCGSSSCDVSSHYWTSQTCELQVKIDLEGRVAIVHMAQSLELRNITQMLQQDTKVFFRVNWTDDMTTQFVENYDEVCNMLGCTRDSFDNLCLCNVSESESIAFTEIPTSDEVLSVLAVGAFEPFTQAIESSSNVEVYSPDGTYSKDTVFVVFDDGGIRHLRKNIVSTVFVGNAKLSFRNPVHFISLADPEIRDAQYETEAALDHYFYHPNTAPFLAIRFAQRFGISNPSPRYVNAIATAFKLGRYDSNGTSFGTGMYGDLAATIAAVLLDRESRTVLLDADPAHGSLLEPFMKYVRIMRSLEYEGDVDRPFVLFEDDLQERLGEEPYKPPSVFSFFTPEYSSSGRISQAGLVSPEGQVLAGGKVISFFDGVFSLLKYGLDRAFDGFGYGRSSSWESREVGMYNESYGHTTVALTGEASEIVDRLATLLTSGRLSTENRAIITSAYVSTMSKGKTSTEALINAEQLIATTAEFHSNTVVQKTGKERSVSAPIEPSAKPYKAVINILLEGGMDSYNLLVPHAGCSRNANGDDLRTQYEIERGDLKFTDDERQLIISAVDQPCSQFAVHDELKVVKNLYDDKDIVFVANTGVINRNQMTKQNYSNKTETQLFAHNAMQAEAQKVDPFKEVTGTGVLGRAADLLVDNGYTVNKITIDNPAVAVVGSVGESSKPLTVSRFGASIFNKRPSRESYFDLEEYAFRLNSETPPQSSMFGETWSDIFVTSINDAKNLLKYVHSSTLSNIWDGKVKDELWYKFSTVAKLIKSHDMRGTDRDMFYFSFSGWDHHSNMKANIRAKFRALNNGLELFVSELKAQEAWDNVTIVFTSDFARTITSNSGAGCDHAWGGHYWMMGGSVDGGKILGKYPDDITTSGMLNIGRGIIIPTTSWDAIWNGIAEWMGINSDQLDKVLPNRDNVVEPGFKLFTAADLYK